MKFAEQCDKDGRLLEYGPSKSLTVSDLPSQPLPLGKFRLTPPTR